MTERYARWIAMRRRKMVDKDCVNRNGGSGDAGGVDGSEGGDE